MKRALLALPLALLLTGCPTSGHNPGPQPPTPTPGDDLIPAMCDHLAELGCEEGASVYNDNLPGPEDVPNQTCADFYLEVQAAGVPVNPKCVLRAPSCDKIADYRAKDPEDC